MKKSKGEIKYDWSNTATVSDGKEAMQWRAQFVGRKRKDKDFDHKKEVIHAFRAMDEDQLKEEELIKREGGKSIQKQITERTWHSQEAWEHGGLRIKDEVKAQERIGIDVQSCVPNLVKSFEKRLVMCPNVKFK